MSNDLIAALLEPGFYDHPVTGCTLIETHISWVILAGDFAYKIKKPVDFGFLDFSTLEKRKFYCEEELRLNRRLAPGIYLGVLAIRGTAEAPCLDGDKPVIEYMVKMRRFEQDCQLDRMLQAGDLKPQHIDSIAKMVAGFHEDIQRATPSDEYGSAEHVYAPVVENFVQIREHYFDKSVLAELADIESWCQTTYLQLEKSLNVRKQHGFIRECHGDMHLRNLAWINDNAVAFDCIEFNPELRWIDTMSEIAFLVMDLQEKQQDQMARRFLNTYLQITGDYEGLRLLHFYLVYRALVRAKVDSIRLAQEDISQEERSETENDFRRYLALASKYIQPAQPVVILTRGMSASGKSTVSQDLLEAMDAIRIRSDVERKRLFNKQAHSDQSASVDAGIYNKDATRLTYDHLAELAEIIIDSDFHVIVDATFLDPAQCKQFRQLAESKQAGFVILEFNAPADVLRKRIVERGKGVSDANLAILENQLRNWHELDEDNTSYTLKVDTTKPIDIATLTEKIGV